VHVEIVDQSAHELVHQVFARPTSGLAHRDGCAFTVNVSAETAHSAVEYVDAFLITSGLMRATAITAVFELADAEAG
jgi:hypothetical protein